MSSGQVYMRRGNTITMTKETSVECT